MTLLEFFNKIGIGNTEIKIEEQKPEQEKPDQEKPDQEKPDQEKPEQEKPEQNNSSSNEQQLIEQLRKEIASLKQSNQDLLLHTQAQPELTTNELILSIAKLGGIIDGE